MDLKVRKSQDYTKFEMLPFNRNVKHLEKLMQSMRRHGFIPAYALHCIRNKSNGKLRIKGGHYRFTAAKKLNIPFYYIVVDDDATVHELECATTPWSLDDYLTSYIREARPVYIAVRKFQERTGISLGLCISLLGGQSAGSGNKVPVFKRGEYELGDPTHANIVADIVLHIEKKCKIPWAANSLFVKALSRVVWVDEFDPTQFKSKVSAHRHLMEKQPNLESYLTMIEQIYNRQSQNKIPLVFLADQVAKKRQKALPK